MAMAVASGALAPQDLWAAQTRKLKIGITGLIFRATPGEPQNLEQALKDMSELVTFSGDGGDPQQWIELFPYLANAGSGVLDLTSIISAAKASGVEHFIVERDLAPDPEADLKASHDHLQAMG